jgi:transcription elongation GreA/GreB family factor
MSRAFVNEDNLVQDVPDRPISTHPNFVTRQGLALIEAAVETNRREHAEAQARGDREAIAKAGRELRYWVARRASAQLMDTNTDADIVQFGSTVTIVRDGGRRQTFRIVGEDEADPSKGTISYISPLAVALRGKKVGDVVAAGRDEAEIVTIG